MNKSLKKSMRRIVKSFLDIAILAILEERGGLNGYEILECISEKLGILLSSGTLYSTLYALEHKHLIKEVEHSKCRIYTLTSKGQATLGKGAEIAAAFKLFMLRLFGKKVKYTASVQQ